jgi:hypothetical protein
MTTPAFGQSSGSEYRGTFRPGHNITFATGLQQSRWSLNLETLEKPLTTERFNFLTTVSYGYHFQVFQWTGLALGTAVHFVLDRTSKDGFKPNFVFVLPSMLAGLVQNLGSDARLLLLGEFGAAWYPYFKWKVSQRQVEFEGAIPDQFSVSAQLDWGLQKRNVVSFIAGWRLASDFLVGDKPTKSADVASFPDLRHEGWALSVGITRQITETLTGVQGNN